MLPVSGAEQLKHFRRPADRAHLLGAQRIFEVGELRAFELETVVDMASGRSAAA